MSDIFHLKGYQIILSKQAKKDLNRIDNKNVSSILGKLKKLVQGYTNLDIKKLKQAAFPRYRLRQGDYRVIFEIQNKILVILVVGAGHRREIYKRMGV